MQPKFWFSDNWGVLAYDCESRYGWCLNYGGSRKYVRSESDTGDTANSLPIQVIFPSIG